MPFLSLLLLLSCFALPGARELGLDPDGDGSPWPKDCNSEDPLVHPNATEVLLNGINDDCDPTTPDHGREDDSSSDSDPAHEEGCDDGFDDDGDGDVDCDDLGCTGAPSCVPVVGSVSPSQGLTVQETTVDISGSGFAWATSGHPEVFVGGASARAVTVVDNFRLTATLPNALASGRVDLEVRNNNGTTTLVGGFAYRQPALYALEGKGGVAGKLSIVTPEGEIEQALMDLPVGATGAAFGPDGTFYMVNSTRRGNLGLGALYTIDVDNGTTNYIGDLIDSNGLNYAAVADITFIGGRLIGFSRKGDLVVEIEPSTGTVKSSIVVGVSSSSSGLAYDEASALLYLGGRIHYGELYTVDPSTGAVSQAVELKGCPTGGKVHAMTMHQGQLLFVSSRADTPATLLRLDPNTGDCTTIMVLSGEIDAIASNTP